jgi:paraquat-inducible protein B
MALEANMSKRASPTLIGGFVVVAVVLGVVAVGVFGSGRFFRKVYPYVLYFTGDVNGLKVGAPVKFKGIEVGSVKNIMLNISGLAPAGGAEDFRIPVIIELDAKNIAEKGARVRPDPETIERLIDLGMRAQLRMESFVTGILYVDLGMYPNSPIHLVEDTTVEHTEIPTLPTALEEAQMKAATFLAKLDELDVEGLVNSLNNTVQGLDELVNSASLRKTLDSLPATVEKIDTTVVQLRETLASVHGLSDDFKGQIRPLAKDLSTTATSADEALQAARRTFSSVGAFLEPESPIVYQLGQTLGELSAAASALRRLAEEIERNPSVLVRGKAINQGGQ